LTSERFADEQLADYIRTVRAEPGSSPRTLGARAMRAGSAVRSAARTPGPALESVTDLPAGGGLPVCCRLYRPSHEARPLVVYFHGGGWTIGDLDTHDGLCRRLALRADVAVLAVHYRRAPESPWPAALDDALAVVRWAQARAAPTVGSSAVAVAGDSAGGTLATLACLRLRDLGQPQPVAQLLAYPNTDLTFASHSVVSKASGWGLDAEAAIWFAEQWVPDPAMRSDPRISPLHEPDLGGLAPAVVVAAEHDPLHDEGDAYAAGLAEADVPTVHRCEVGLVHGFLGLEAISPAAAAAANRFFADAATALSGSAAGRR
jgi:acetyl esterase